MLKADHLSCCRENKILFSNLSFEVPFGSILWVSGENGCGKSSLLKILAGFSLAESGQVSWKGRSIQSQDPFFLQSLLYIGHKIAIQPELTPLENLRGLLTVSALQTFVNKDYQAALEAVGLNREVHKLRCAALSKGQRQRVALARLWLEPTPPCWMLDEPCTSLDKASITLLEQRIIAHAKNGGILIIVSHYPLNFAPFKPLEIALGNRQRC